MEQQNNERIRRARAGMQQMTITICCLGFLIFFMAWTINVAAKGRSILAAAPSDPAADKFAVSQADNAEEASADNSGAAAINNDDTDPEDPLSDIPASEFADAVFVGNSLTVGLQMNSDKPMATFYASTGLNVSTIATEASILLDNGNYGTVYDALAQKQFGRVYVMFGINELGWPYPDVFQKEYETALNRIKELQPDADIYVQSVLPVSTLAQNENIVFTNENVDNMNVYVRNAAENTGCIYLDVASALKDENGALPQEASTDGIHLIKEYCQVWIKYLEENS